MLKLLWNIHGKKDKLWVKWLDEYYMKGRDIFQIQINATWSWMLKQILKVRDDIEDTQKWNNILHQDKFHTKQWYQAIRGEKEQVPWKHVLYSNVARPGALFQLWLLFMGRLATKDRLIQFGVNVDKTCVFCHEDESIDHLFFDCRKTYYVWKKIMNWIGYVKEPRQWAFEKMWLAQECRKKGWRRHMLRITLAETIYFVWKARNEAIFNHVHLDPIEDIKTSVMTRSSLSKHIRGHIDAMTMSFR